VTILTRATKRLKSILGRKDNKDPGTAAERRVPTVGLSLAAVNRLKDRALRAEQKAGELELLRDMAERELDRYLALGTPPPMKENEGLYPDLKKGGNLRAWSTFRLGEECSYLSNACFRLFSTPLGQVGQGKVSAMDCGDTNMRESGMLPGGFPVLLTGLIVELVGFTDEQAALMQEHGMLSFDLTQTQLDLTALGALSWAPDKRVGWLDLVSEPEAEIPTAQGPWRVDGAGIFVPRRGSFSVLLRFGELPASTGSLRGRVRITLVGTLQGGIEIGAPPAPSGIFASA